MMRTLLIYKFGPHFIWKSLLMRKTNNTVVHIFIYIFDKINIKCTPNPLKICIEFKVKSEFQRLNWAGVLKWKMCTTKKATFKLYRMELEWNRLKDRHIDSILTKGRTNVYLRLSRHCSRDSLPVRLIIPVLQTTKQLVLGWLCSSAHVRMCVCVYVANVSSLFVVASHTA